MNNFGESELDDFKVGMIVGLVDDLQDDKMRFGKVSRIFYNNNNEPRVKCDLIRHFSVSAHPAAFYIVDSEILTLLNELVNEVSGYVILNEELLDGVDEN